jgi:SAM-dependent methyltransferase
VLGKRWTGRQVAITAVDPLADQYATLFERTGVTPLVKPIRGEAEQVSNLFPPRSFDLVYAQNCLDHGYDPLRSIQQMLELVKPTGGVLLEHAIDEREHMKYAGPHQWNFRAEHGRFVISRPGLWVDAHAELARAAYIDVENCPDIRWIRVTLRRVRPSRFVRLLRRVRS